MSVVRRAEAVRAPLVSQACCAVPVRHVSAAQRYSCGEREPGVEEAKSLSGILSALAAA